MTDLEVFKLSANSCKCRIANIYENRIGILVELENGIAWNPFTNAEQRWECVEKLLEMGPVNFLNAQVAEMYPVDPFAALPILIKCPASEFPARALAELQKRKES